MDLISILLFIVIGFLISHFALLPKLSEGYQNVFRFLNIGNPLLDKNVWNTFDSGVIQIPKNVLHGHSLGTQLPVLSKPLPVSSAPTGLVPIITAGEEAFMPPAMNCMTAHCPASSNMHIKQSLF